MLITKNDIATYKPLSKSANDIIVNEAILSAETEHLVPLIGERFYNDINNNPTKYGDLLNETTYSYQGNAYSHRGLKCVLAYFAYANYIVNANVADTAFGQVYKNGQDSTKVENKDLAFISKQNKSTALSYWEMVSAYLERNADKYPLFSSGRCGGASKRYNFSLVRK